MKRHSQRRADIRALPHETLVIHGRERPRDPAADLADLAGWIQRAQLHVYGQCGHWTQIEPPRALPAWWATSS